MAERTPEHDVAGGTNVQGQPRRVMVTAHQPGKVALTIYVGVKPFTAIVSVAELHIALGKAGR